MTQSFFGYERPDGRFGARNHVAVLPSVGCANEVARAISERVPGTTSLLHHQGCCQLAPDLDIVSRTLVGFGKNPNVASALIVSLGCEAVSAEGLASEIAKTGKRVESVVIQELGGLSQSVKKGTRLARDMVAECSRQSRYRTDVANLVVGLKCGASDTTSGLASNPAVGACTDLLVAQNATIITAETTEIMGAEHILAARAINEAVAERILAIVENMESRVKSIGVDMRGSQPTPGNIAGGLTTIEEKSLGAICKAGTSMIQSVLEYGETPRQRGLHVMDTPGSEMHVLPALAAAGAQIILFTTGRGAPQGFPTVPVIKICGNRKTCIRMNEHIDMDVSGILGGEETVRSASHRILDLTLKVASGELTKAEVTGYGETLEIYTHGPLI